MGWMTPGHVGTLTTPSRPVVEVLDEAELVVLDVLDDHDPTLVVLMSFTGRGAAERDDLGDAVVDVVDLDVEVEPVLGPLDSGTGWKTRRGCASPRVPR